MNYFEKHIGDYTKKTAHLTMMEQGAYNLLLDRYYDTEQPIPENQVHRLVRARTPQERAATDAVLSEFFNLHDGMWHHERCDTEIAKAQARIEAAKNNGKRGGRPAKTAPGLETGTDQNGSISETQTKPSGLLLGSISETQTKALHTPVSIQEEKPPLPPLVEKPGRASKRGSRLPENWILKKEWGEWAMANGLTSPDAVRLEAAKFRDYWVAKAGASATKADWLATWRNWVRTAVSRSPGLKSASPATPEPIRNSTPVDELYA